MASLQAAGCATARQSPGSSSSSLARLQSTMRISTPSHLSSLRKSVQFTADGKSMAGCKNVPVGKGSRTRRSRRRCLVRSAVVLQERSYGAAVVQGTARTILEDTLSIAVDPKGEEPSFFGVFDGHGGTAVAELLKASFWPVYKDKLSGSDPEKATTSAYFDVDKQTLAQPKGLFGVMRERGIGGSKCGATAATAAFLPSKDGKKLLVAANVGDARIVLCRGGTAIQLTVDHKPDVEAERKRIEAKNPTPKKPLVINVDGIWRVGGLLNLSRAFGDAYLKEWPGAGRDAARGGFGLTAEPHVTVETLLPEDEFVIVGTDGLFEFIPNDEVVDLIRSAGKDESLEETVSSLIKLAQERGTTDDISVVIVRPLEVPGCKVEVEPPASYPPASDSSASDPPASDSSSSDLPASDLSASSPSSSGS